MTDATTGGPRRRPTIRDVARRAGVSKSLVSLVFSAPGSVSAERTARVLAAAEDLGYRPNRVARSMNGTRDDFVGILVADLDNPVFAEVVDAARGTLAAAGRLGLMTGAMLPGVPGDARALDLDAIAMLADLRPSGILLVGSIPDMPAVAAAVDGARIVVVSAVPDGIEPAGSVRGDDDQGMRRLVGHLTDLGHRRIAHVGGVGSRVAEARAAAFRTAATEHGIAADLVAPSDFTEHAGLRAAESLLDLPTPPTAITALNDLAAAGVLAAVRRRGLADRVAVTGWDNSTVARLGPVDLTSVDPDNAAIGQCAAELLLAADGSGAAGEGVAAVLVAPSIVVRGSTRDVAIPSR